MRREDHALGRIADAAALEREGIDSQIGLVALVLEELRSNKPAESMRGAVTAMQTL